MRKMRNATFFLDELLISFSERCGNVGSDSEGNPTSFHQPNVADRLEPCSYEIGASVPLDFQWNDASSCPPSASNELFERCNVYLMGSRSFIYAF